MLIKNKLQLSSSEITKPDIFRQRRQILKGASALVASNIIPAFAAEKKSDLRPTPAELIKNYTNYYEFSIDKEEPAHLAQALQTKPWQIKVIGEVENPLTYDVDDLLKQHMLEERVYRFRCVEAWSAVIPWLGFELGSLLKKAKPLSSAKFVKLTAVYQPENMPNQRNKVLLNWPYSEALRIDEAIHPLTLLAVGMYGEMLPKQNGAPLRLIVPWKYGFKSIKAIVKIELLEKQPLTSWNQQAPDEYGFYANVNPSVPHPRWSQSSERVLGSDFFTPRRKTEIFNGYGEQVAHLYQGMDLKKFF